MTSKIRALLATLIKKIAALHLAVRLSVVALCFITTFVIVGRYADISIHDYGQGLVDTNASANIGSGVEGVWRSLVRWDSNHYVQIVERGYTQQQTAFFPLYPLLVAGVGHLLGIGTAASLFVVSWFFALLSCIVLYYWAIFELKKRRLAVSAWSVLGLTAIFPTSFFFVAGYTESLFFFLTVSSLYAYRSERYILSGVLISLSTATRVQGGALAIFYLLDYLTKKEWRNWKRLIPVAMAPLGLVAYMVYLGYVYENPFEFIAAQAHWGRLSGDIIGNLASSFTPVYLWYIPVLMVGLWAIYKYLGWTWFVYSAIFILIPITSGRLDSLNRYMLVLPPLFLALLLLGMRVPVWLRNIFLVSSAFLLAWNVLLFTNNYWVG